MTRLPTLELHALPRRIGLMAVTALTVVFVDLLSKAVVVEFEPDALLFNASDRTRFGLGTGLIAVAAASSVLACVIPHRFVAVGAGLALGGSLGNLSSRQLWSALGGSPDFIRFADGSTGNLADLSIVAGVAAMLLGTIAWLLWKTFGAGRVAT